MRYAPILLAMAGLLIVVIIMAGPGERRITAARNIGLTIVILLALALLFGLVARQAL